MTLKDYFKKDINRTIETVIKADDRDHIADEVGEYVITQEITKKIADFFQAYTGDYAGANGVWISGFFGSGKSHLLKILSYVLENKPFTDGNSGEVFAEKIEADALLKGAVKSAIRIPSESILFNIDQQAGKEQKTNENAVLSVFYKVFFDHLGYYGFMPHVAEFEMWLDQADQFADFKKQFAVVHGKDWTIARRKYFDPLVTDAIGEVLGKINNVDASKYEDVLDKLEDNQKQSIENLCERVDAYIKTKPKGFRLNFFVDEIGQYISDNTKLMLNLQTIAETLATKTKGASWILVTSQEDMDSVVGDLGQKQKNDFSRIQARFKIKTPLTSANVDEVIEKRLLDKNPEVEKILKAVWKKENAHLSTLLSFSDVGVQFKGYKGEKDFISKFPFVPYQFDLFQQCRRALSSHNAFSGKHSSVGERSMLGVFQQVVLSIGDKGENALVSFDKMFAGISKELKGEIQASINLAEKNLDNPFHVDVLKALFLVKYFANFKTTRRNISVLMINDMHMDLKVHEKNIDEALNTLENQSYIQRNGDIYEFLTDDEKDVEQEIKSTEVDKGADTNLLKEILFDEVIKDNRIKYLENKQDYEFCNKIDDVLLTRQKELEIEIITPNYDNYENLTAIQSQTMGTSIMKIVLPSDAIFMKDLKMYLRTAKYVKQSQSTTNSNERKRILHEKGQQNIARRRSLTVMANKLLGEANIYMNGSLREMTPTADGKTKVIKAFQDLIKTVYTNLPLLGSIPYSEDTIKSTLFNPDTEIFNADDAAMSPAENEILREINLRKRQSDRTSLNDLKDRFTKKSYGWYPNAIWTLTAKLYKRGKIELRQNGNLLDDGEVLQAFLNSKNHITTSLEAQRIENPKEVRDLKQCYSELFDSTISSSIGKEVATAFKEQLLKMHNDVRQIVQNVDRVHFLKALEPMEQQLARLSKKEYSYFLSNLKDYEDELLTAKEDILAPIKKFWNGEQKNIYDEIGYLLQGDTSNLEFVEGDELNLLRQVHGHEKPYMGNLIKEAKAAKDKLDKKLNERIESEKAETIQVIEAVTADLKGKKEFKELSEAQQQQLLEPFQNEIDRLQSQRFIATLRDVRAKIKASTLPQQLTKMMQLQVKPVTSENGGVQDKVPEIKYVTRADIKTDFDRTELANEQDVDEYVEALRKALKAEIKNHHRISI
jgi:hypothetical protein